MEIRGNLMASGRAQELLAVVDVQSDTHEVHPAGTYDSGQTVKRRIVGTIRECGSLWKDFMAFHSHRKPATDPEDGKAYLGVEGLFVDHDYYAPQLSLINVDGRTIRFLLIEDFDGKPEDYPKELKARNQRIQDEIDKWESGNVTRNDLRALTGLEPRDGPHFNERLPAEALPALLERFRKERHFNYIT